jgi:hypothetical protein
MEFRLKNEDILIAKALQQPLLGWGGWGRSRVYDNWGRDVSITDGFWVIELGTRGLVGVVAAYTILLLPLAVLLWKLPTRELMSARTAPVLALAISVTLFAIDCIPNGMVNPLYVLVNGAVISYVLRLRLNAMSDDTNEEYGRRKVAAGVPVRRLHPGYS